MTGWLSPVRLNTLAWGRAGNELAVLGIGSDEAGEVAGGDYQLDDSLTRWPTDIYDAWRQFGSMGFLNEPNQNWCFEQ